MTKLVNRAKMSTATTGTGTLTLGSAATGYQSFAAAGVADGDVIRYVIEDGAGWEIGTGTYTATGTTLTRTPSESSDGGTAITLTGNAVVFVSAVAADLGDALGTVASDTLDLSTGNFFEVTAADQTLVFSNPPDVHKFTIKVLGGGSVAGFDLGIASYDAVSFSVSAQETSPSGVFFKPDGTKMFVIGTTTNTVREYNLSTAWDVSSASYLQPFGVSSQDTFNTDLFFKPDGSKMFTVGAGNTNKNVNEYSLGSNWDISTSVFSQSFALSGQDSSPQGIFFKPDGTKMFMIGVQTDRVYEYSLNSAWDVSSAVFVRFFSIVLQEATPMGVAFSADGDRMFVLGFNDIVYEYALTLSWDVSTASYLRNFSVAAQENTPRALTFKPDGGKMYILGSAGVQVYQYTTGVASIAAISYPASVSFASGSTPAAPAIGAVNTVDLYTVDGGTNYYDRV